MEPYRRTDRNWFASAQHLLIDGLLGAESIVCLVATAKDDPDQVYGYIVACPGLRVLHWIYVKAPFRRAGVANRLMEASFSEPGETIEATFDTPKLDHLDKWVITPRSYRICEAITQL